MQTQIGNTGNAMKILKWLGLSLITLLILVLIFVFVQHQRHYQEDIELTDELRSGAPGEFVSLSGGQTHYEVAGPADGEVVVLIHGFSIPAVAWEGTFQELAAQGFRVVRYDLFGRGYSDRPDTAYNSTLFRTQLIELMDYLELREPVHLAGLSMGGAVAMHVAAQIPERIGNVALIAPLHEPLAAPPMPHGIGYYMMSGFYVPGMRSALEADFLGEQQARTMQEAYDQQTRIKGFNRAITNTVYNFTQEQHPDAYRAANMHGVPVLLVWGTDDDVVSFSGHEGVQADANVVQFVSVEGAGHTPHLERPQVVLPALINFYRGHH